VVVEPGPPPWQRSHVDPSTLLWWPWGCVMRVPPSSSWHTVHGMIGTVSSWPPWQSRQVAEVAA
jgi:hypothetical protein